MMLIEVIETPSLLVAPKFCYNTAIPTDKIWSMSAIPFLPQRATPSKVLSSPRSVTHTKKNMISENKVTAVDLDIPFSRMVVLSFKWIFAALPAFILAYLLIGGVLVFVLNSQAGIMELWP